MAPLPSLPPGASPQAYFLVVCTAISVTAVLLLLCVLPVAASAPSASADLPVATMLCRYVVASMCTMLTTITSIPSGMASNASPRVSSWAPLGQRAPGYDCISHHLGFTANSTPCNMPYRTILGPGDCGAAYGCYHVLGRQRMVCVAHAAQHCPAQAALACVVCWHDLYAIAEAQIPGEMGVCYTQVIGELQHLKTG